LWPLLFGCLEASFALHAVLWARRRRREDFALCIAIALVFVATASRSFIFIALAAIAIVYLERRRPPLWAVTVALAAGITFAGSIGYLRVSSELGAQTVNQSLIERELPAGPLGLTLSNLSTGPWVLSTTLYSVPQRVEFQHGMFFLRDGLNVWDSSVVRSDRWVTESILERDPAANGGMPPTLLGGLYLDFGFTGIAVGLFLAGAVTVWLYPVASRRGLPGRLQYCLWCTYLLTSLYSYFSLKPAFVASILLLEVLVRLDLQTSDPLKPSFRELRAGSRAL
jgi:oligosaccharide repeat unit polymerase